jgi:hypothetical protein
VFAPVAAATLSLTGGGAAIAAGTASPPAGQPVHATSQAGQVTGAAWQIVKTVEGTASSAPVFTAITATSTHDAWAFESTSSKPVAWRLTGSVWNRAAFPGRTGETVIAAGASSPDNVWAFTLVPGGSGRALAWNGRSWAVVRQFRNAVSGALVLGRHDVWVFGQSFPPGSGLGTWHYNGASWQQYKSVPMLRAASALSASNIWAVGGTIAAHWNGRAWSKTSLARLLPRPTPLSLPSADSVYAQSPRDVWVVGAAHFQDERGPFVMLHYNGTRWQRVALLSRYGAPLAIVPDGFGGLWIPTIYGVPGDFTMLHYSGGHLLAVKMPLPPSKLTVQTLAHVAHTTHPLARDLSAGGRPATGGRRADRGVYAVQTSPKVGAWHASSTTDKAQQGEAQEGLSWSGLRLADRPPATERVDLSRHGDAAGRPGR